MIVVAVMKNFISSKIDSLAPMYDIPFPYPLNMPYELIRDPGAGLFTTNCNKVIIRKK